jgi:hypothetical protein
MDLIGDAKAASAIARITRSSHPAQKSEDAALGLSSPPRAGDHRAPKKAGRSNARQKKAG